MEKSRRKIRICLFCVVILAIVLGITYYVYDSRAINQISEGTLIARVVGWVGSLWR